MSDNTKEIVKAGIDKALNDFTLRLKNHGFERTKKKLWVRLNSRSADFIHVHVDGISYGGPLNNSVSFRIHCGNRVLDNPSDSLSLNGPDSDSPESRQRRYHLRFNAKSGSTYDRCIDDSEKFVVEIGEPWFQSNSPSENRHKDIDSRNVQFSYKVLGVKVKKH